MEAGETVDMPARRTAETAGPSIRRIAGLWTVVLGGLVMVAVAGLVWTGTVTRQSIATVARATESRAVANELLMSLYTYRQLGNAYVATGNAALNATRKDVVADMGRLLARAEQDVTSARERNFLDQTSRDLIMYLQQREQLEAQGFELEEIIRLTHGPSTQVIDAVRSVRDANAARVEQAQAEALRANRLSTIVGLAAAVLFMLGLIGLVVGVHRFLLRPILGLHATILRLRSGETEARVVDGGLLEISELSRGFNEMAEALARQREDQLTFLAGVAHDLRNPLAALKMGIIQLEQPQSEPRRRQVAQVLDRQIDRLGRMVHDLLDAARIEAGKLQMQLENLDLREVVDAMVGLYAPTSPDHQIMAHVPAQSIVVRGDPMRLEQVVSNLLSNAIKFTPGGGPIDVSVELHDDTVVLSVSDSGIGIPPQELQDIFLPFRRRRADVPPGASLGLSVVRRIVTAHGGSIDVQSEVGRGSIFRVTLPRAVEERSEAAQAVSRSQVPRPPPVPAHS